MLDFLVKRPLTLSAIGCISASILGFYSKSALLCYIVLATSWLFLFILKKNFNLTAVCFITVICAFSVLLTVNRIQAVTKFQNKTENCTFIVNNITYSNNNYYYADCEIINRNDSLNRANVSVLLYPPEVKSGDILKGDLTFSEVDKKYISNSYSNKIYLNAKSENITKTNQKDFILNTAQTVRNYIKNSLFSNMDYSEAATLCALLFGDRSYFTDSFYSCVLASGTSHVMVVSGMHLSIIVMLFTYFINKVVYNRYMKAFLIILSVLIMTTLCGFTMSILRAGITYAIMAFAITLGRNHTPENTLGGAISIILVFSPFAIFSVALQLSALSTFGILCVSIPFISYLKNANVVKSKLLLSFIATISVSLSALLLTLPITIYVFGYISKTTVITNLLISTPITFAVVLSVIALILNLIFPPVANFIFTLCEAVTAYINQVIITFGNNKDFIAYIDRKYWIVAVLLIIFVFWLLLTCKKRINMLRLEEKRNKILKEGGKKLKWQ